MYTPFQNTGVGLRVVYLKCDIWGNRIYAITRSFAPHRSISARLKHVGSRWVYLASGLGFSAQERALVLPGLVRALERAGCNVFEPFTDNAEGAKTATKQPPGWAYRIGQADVDAVRRCDAVFCCANMNPPCDQASPGKARVGIIILCSCGPPQRCVRTLWFYRN